MGVQINGSEGNVIATKGTFSGDVGIGGTLTYEDVTNIDSVGLVTARSGIEIGARPGVAASISVDGNMIVSGISTFGGDVSIADKIIHTGDTDTAIRFSGADTIKLETGGSERLKVDSNGDTIASGTLYADSHLFMIDKLMHTGDTDTAIRFPAADTITAETGGSERFRITSTGKVLVNTTTASSVGNSTYSMFEVSGNTSGATGPGHLSLKKGVASASLSDGDTLSRLIFSSLDGGDFAYIQASVDGSPSGSDFPASLRFHTCADGANSSTERLRIASDGKIYVGGNGASATAGELWFNDTSAYSSKIAQVAGSSALTFHTGQSQPERFRIDSGGAITVGTRSDIHSSNALARFGIDCHGRNVLSDPTNCSAYGLAFYNDPTTDQANGIGFFNDDGSTCGGYILHQDKGSGNLGDIVFGTSASSNNPEERMRITNDGYSKHSDDGTYDTYSNAVQAHQFRQSANKPTLWCSNTNTSTTWDIIRSESARTNNSAFHFFICTSGNLTDDEFRVRGDGNVYADGSFNSGGADYAEYFEWSDGNSSNEDRRGMTVVLDGNKVKLSTSSDSTDNIIGVVSGNASVIGDAASEKWTDKYLKDDYGAYQRDENGERKLNPSFDDTKTYVSREDRQEWDAIGMVGKLRIRKGQQTGTRWIKMRDISGDVEEWLVR